MLLACLLSPKLMIRNIFVQKILICFIDGTLASAAKGKAEQKPPGVSSMYIGAERSACNLSMSFRTLRILKLRLSSPFYVVEGSI